MYFRRSEGRGVRVEGMSGYSGEGLFFFSSISALACGKIFVVRQFSRCEYAGARLVFKNGEISNCGIDGIKTLRECENILIKNCVVHSPEFGWKCRGIDIEASVIESEYFLFESKDIKIRNLRMNGKYSFQYIDNMTIENSFLDTKDAFWHSKNVTVKDSVVKGEYLGWYSEGLTLIRCEIIGTQPLCYCKRLKLVDCRMYGCDLAFEYSDVNATIDGHIDSVKNPKSGKIVADSVGKIISEDSVVDCGAEILVRGENVSAE